MKFIQLTRGYAAIVDDADYNRVMAAGPWQTVIKKSTGMVYALRTVPKLDGKPTTQRLHRFILGLTDPKVQVDHRNRYGLDNQRSNLRVATSAQNGANRSKQRGTSSRFKGVHWNKTQRQWTAYLYVNRKKVYLGIFADELSAARAYDAFAREHFGEFAKLNLGQKPKTTKG
jgi:hypothetical protein